MMRALRGIKSLRNFEKRVSWDIVFEWEDVISTHLGVPVVTAPKWQNDALKVFRKFGLWNVAASISEHFSSFDICFEMAAEWERVSLLNRANMIPILIDFWIDEDQASGFASAYSRCPLVLVSSRQAFNVAHRVLPCNVEHLALSIPDKYIVDNVGGGAKKYDLVLAGRQNKVLAAYLVEYCRKYPDFEYVDRIQSGSEFLLRTNKGRDLGKANTREEYIAVLNSSRIAFYSTPGIDGGEKRTKGMNPVTPRFLELLSSGCNVIARYEDNADSEYYGLDGMCARVTDYESFEAAMNAGRETIPDSEAYTKYLRKHSSSTRAQELKKLLTKHGIET